MKDWIFKLVEYILSNWQELLWGGVCSVSLVIFILGCFKPLIKKWIKNETVRKVVLAWSSVALNIPMTAGSIWINGLSTDHFWTLAVVNAVCTIVVYFLYENTALRNALHWLGKKIFTAFFSDSATGTMSMKNIRKEAEALLAPAISENKTTAVATNKTKSRYNNDLHV